MVSTNPGSKPTHQSDAAAEVPSNAGAFMEVRSQSLKLCEPLETEDYVVQSMPDASPVRWHLAHTTWFFETFLLKPFARDYKSPNPNYEYLFNSYYNAVGEQYPRPRRGLLTRPTVAEIRAWRARVDEQVSALLDSPPPGHAAEIRRIAEIGLHHEQQHQELMLTDLKHTFAQNPLHPVYSPRGECAPGDPAPLLWQAFPEGIREIGYRGAGFHFDNEAPRHRVFQEAFELASRPVSNGEFIAFVKDNGYARPELWLSNGWAKLQETRWNAPLYWERRDGKWWHYTLAGFRKVDPAEPVCHVSYYEADAYARWAGARLAREDEWEVAVAALPLEGNFADSERYAPSRCPAGEGLRQLYGDVWEWTASPYVAYPGYRPAEGALGEYNGKFMCDQWVLRGGSCATPGGHIRATYRNFFPADARWQFSGIRLARNAR